jgi:hypothetical protein
MYYGSVAHHHCGSEDTRRDNAGGIVSVCSQSGLSRGHHCACHSIEDILRTLRLSDRNDPIALMVAKKIIELAKQGQHNPERLRPLVISQFQKRLR